MNLELSEESIMARASPVSDALQRPLVAVENEQRVSQNPRLRPKKLVGNKNKNKNKNKDGKGKEELELVAGILEVLQRKEES